MQIEAYVQLLCSAEADLVVSHSTPLTVLLGDNHITEEPSPEAMTQVTGQPCPESNRSLNGLCINSTKPAQRVISL